MNRQVYLLHHIFNKKYNLLMYENILRYLNKDNTVIYTGIIACDRLINKKILVVRPTNSNDLFDCFVDSFFRDWNLRLQSITCGERKKRTNLNLHYLDLLIDHLIESYAATSINYSTSKRNYIKTMFTIYCTFT